MLSEDKKEEAEMLLAVLQGKEKAGVNTYIENMSMEAAAIWSKASGSPGYERERWERALNKNSKINEEEKLNLKRDLWRFFYNSGRCLKSLQEMKKYKSIFRTASTLSVVGVIGAGSLTAGVDGNEIERLEDSLKNRHAFVQEFAKVCQKDYAENKADTVRRSVKTFMEDRAAHPGQDKVLIIDLDSLEADKYLEECAT